MNVDGRCMWERIADDWRAKIRSGQWPVGYRLPTQPVLAVQYRCAVLTIARVAGRLKRDGLLVTSPGGRVYVGKAPKEKQQPRVSVLARVERLERLFAEKFGDDND
ncbi:MAG TPA: GntR family transcriptional regulator [Asanoa sp.]|nr:GntR family transcriptional regulator [Asanoa sp.]